MVRKVTAMRSAEMEAVCRKMADAFLDYDRTEGNLGMCEYLDREHFYRFTRGCFEAAVRNGSLYCAGDRNEGFMIFETPETEGDILGGLLQLIWALRAYGPFRAVRQVREITRSGPFVGPDMDREKRPYTKIEFIAVTKEYQGMGFMRKMIDYAFSESDRLGLPCILTTDDVRKVKIYEHYGMEMIREHILAPNAAYYEMYREGRGI